MAAPHSEYGGSKAHRWVNCPGSVALCRGLDSSGGEAAREGRLAHALAEHCLVEGVDALEALPFTFDVSDPEEQPDVREADEDMARNVQPYLDICRTVDADERFIEVTLPFDPWVPGEYGTLDHAAIEDGVAYIDDLKFGRGVLVDAEGNEQLLLMALAFYEDQSLLHDINEFVLRITQPRREHYSEWRITLEDLLAHGERFHAQWKLSKQPDAPLIPGDKQCQFCPAMTAGTCPAVAKLTEAVVSAELEDVEAIEQGGFTVADAEQVPMEAVAKAIEHSAVIRKFLDRVYARGLEAALRGEAVPGFKLVEGKRGNRSWKDATVAERELKKMRFKQSEMYDIKLASPTQIEKVAGPRQRKKLDELITRSEGKPTLVPETDRRPALPSIKDELDDTDDVLGLVEADDDLGLD